MTSNLGSETILNFEDLEAVGDKHRAEILVLQRLNLWKT